MQLEQKYELLEAVGELTGEQDQTIPAWERSTGKLVFVHFLAGGYKAENNAVLTAVGRLSPEHRQHVLAAGDHAGSAYVITDALPWGVTLRNWITNMSPKEEAPPTAPEVKVEAPPAAPEVPVKVEAPTPPPAASELARAGTWKIPAFDAAVKSEPVEARQPELTPPAPPKLEPVVTPTSSAAAPAPAAPEREPGEFTRLMRAGMAEPPASLEIPKPAPSGSPTSGHTPGEFTQMLRAMKPDPAGAVKMPSSPGPPVTPEAKPGEFTQLLRGLKPEPPASPVQRSAPPEAARVADEFIPPIAPPPLADVPLTPDRGAASGQGGDFTNWFQQPLQAPTPKPASPQPAAAAPWQFDTPGASAAPPVAPAPPVRPGQGEFTQMFRPPQTPSPGAPASPPVSQGEGGFTQLLRAPAPPAGGVFVPPAPGPADADLFKAPGRENVAGGPSFTQFLAVSTPTPPAPPPAAAPKPAAKGPALASPPRSYLPIILIVGLLFVLMIAVILILWLRK
jgi:hypothetical protein